MQEIRISHLQRLVQEKTGIPTHEQRLIFAGKQLEEEKYMSDYPKLDNKVTLFLILRLPGGATKLQPFDVSIERSLPQRLPKSTTVCMICFEEPALLMPCKSVKHSICSTCLMNYSWNEVSSREKTAINCAMCGSEWGLDIIEKYGKATNEEIELLAEGLSMNVIRSDPNVIECPGCNSYCERQNRSKSRVHCRMCQRNGKKNPEFCWYCLHPWTSSSTTDCGYAECKAAGLLAQIQKAPLIKVIGVTCPSIRLCPDCGSLIEHNTEGCKHMTCKSCKAQFCFLCLRTRKDGSWECGSKYTKCQPAPVQTHVPR